MPSSRQKKPARQQRQSDHVTLLVDTLKRLFRAKGLTYRNVATAMKVSEVTVKRWFSNQNMTLKTVEALCDLAGVTLPDLMELATRDTDPRQPRLTLEQEHALAENGQSAFIFTLLLAGWSAEELKRECGIDEAMLVGYLVYLDRLRLIDLLPGNIVRLLTKREIDWRRDGPVRRMFNIHVKHFFDQMDFNDPDALWESEHVRLSKNSLARLQTMFVEFRRDIRALGEADRLSQGGDKAWYATLIAASALSFEFEALPDRDGSGRLGR